MLFRCTGDGGSEQETDAELGQCGDVDSVVIKQLRDNFLMYRSVPTLS